MSCQYHIWDEKKEKFFGGSSNITAKHYTTTLKEIAHNVRATNSKNKPNKISWSEHLVLIFNYQLI